MGLEGYCFPVLWDEFGAGMGGRGPVPSNLSGFDWFATLAGLIAGLSGVWRDNQQAAVTFGLAWTRVLTLCGYGLEGPGTLSGRVQKGNLFVSFAFKFWRRCCAKSWGLVPASTSGERGPTSGWLAHGRCQGSRLHSFPRGQRAV